MNKENYEQLIQQVTEKVWKYLTPKKESMIVCESLRKLPEAWKKELTEIGTLSLFQGNENQIQAKLLILDELSIEQIMAIRFHQVKDEKTEKIATQLKQGRPVWVLQSFQEIIKDYQLARYGLKKDLSFTQELLTSFGMAFVTSDYHFQQELSYIKKRVR